MTRPTVRARAIRRLTSRRGCPGPPAACSGGIGACFLVTWVTRARSAAIGNECLLPRPGLLGQGLRFALVKNFAPARPVAGFAGQRCRFVTKLCLLIFR